MVSTRQLDSIDSLENSKFYFIHCLATSVELVTEAVGEWEAELIKSSLIGDREGSIVG